MTEFEYPAAIAARGSQNTTTYLAIAGPDGCLIPGKLRRLADIKDAHELTLMVNRCLSPLLASPVPATSVVRR